MRKVIAEIFEETDYTVFKALPDNRDVLKTRLDKLVASMSEKYLLNPIMVNANMQIIDGQGRYEARKKMGKPIHYFVEPTATSDDCRLMNKYNKAWSNLDFAKSYARAGNANYQLLLKACGDYDLAIGSVLKFSNKSTASRKDKGYTTTPAMSRFERGELLFTEEDYKTVGKVWGYAKDIHGALLLAQHITKTFGGAVMIISSHPEYDHERMIKNCKMNRASFAYMSNTKDQVAEFERIYNYKAKKSRIYFSDYYRNKGYSVRNYDQPEMNAHRNDYKSENMSTLRISNEV